MALERSYTSGCRRNRLADESCTLPLLAGTAPVISPDRTPPLAAVVLILGLAFLAGFAVGLAVEYANLRLRERELARGRRLLAARARGLRRQLVELHRLRDGAPDADRIPDHLTVDREDHLP